MNIQYQISDCACGLRITLRAGDIWRDSEGDPYCCYMGPSTIPRELHGPAEEDDES